MHTVAAGKEAAGLWTLQTHSSSTSVLSVGGKRENEAIIWNQMCPFPLLSSSLFPSFIIFLFSSLWSWLQKVPSPLLPTNESHTAFISTLSCFSASHARCFLLGHVICWWSPSLSGCPLPAALLCFSSSRLWSSNMPKGVIPVSPSLLGEIHTHLSALLYLHSDAAAGSCSGSEDSFVPKSEFLYSLILKGFG